jgi:hypothetical protein
MDARTFLVINFIYCFIVHYLTNYVHGIACHLCLTGSWIVLTASPWFYYVPWPNIRMLISNTFYAKKFTDLSFTTFITPVVNTQSLNNTRNDPVFDLLIKYLFQLHY